jgi:hypothetical protein
MVGYNVQSAVDTKHHLIITHEVTNVGSDRSQLARMTEQARAAIGSEAIEAVADRGYYSGEEIVACEQAGITVYLPKPMTSGLLAKGRFGKQDFVYVAADDVYLCPAGEQLTYRYSNEEEGKTLRRYWTTSCQACALKRSGRRRIDRSDPSMKSALPIRPPPSNKTAFLHSLPQKQTFCRRNWMSAKCQKRPLTEN